MLYTVALALALPQLLQHFPVSRLESAAYGGGSCYKFGLPCSWQSDGECKVSEHDDYGDCDVLCCSGPSLIPSGTFASAPDYGCYPPDYAEGWWACNLTKITAAGPPPHPGTKPASCVELVTIDFDGTLEYTDALSHIVIDGGLGVNGAGRSATDLIPTYERVVSSCNSMRNFTDMFFGGEARVDELRKAIAALRERTEGNVYMLTASWYHISGSVWANYVHQITSDLGLGFSADHVIGLDDPGGAIPAPKGARLAQLAGQLGVDIKRGVHIDNSFKYDTQAIVEGGNYLYPAPLEASHVSGEEWSFPPRPSAAPVMGQDLEFLLKAAC